MKVLHVTPFFTPARGGSAIIPYQLSKELSKRGHDVSLLTTNFEFDEEYAHSLIDVEIVKFKCVADLGLFLYSPNIKKWCVKNLKSFDIIHLHNFRSYQNNVVYHYAKNYKIPYVLQPHGSIPRIMEKQTLKRLYDRVWGHRILNGASKVIAVSKAEVEQCKLEGVEENNIVLIPNGLDLEAFNNSPPYGRFKEKYDIGDKQMILFVGRIHKIKGIDFLIKAFALLSTERNDIILVIVGPDDGYLSDVEKLLSDLNLMDKVKLIGFIDNVMEAYRDADLLVYPSVYEIFGLVPFEAIMCGTPIVVTDNCGCSELVKEAYCGLLTKYGDVYDLKEKMKYILENQDESKKMVEKGKKFIMENLTWDKVVTKVEDVYENCIRNV